MISHIGEKLFYGQEPVYMSSYFKTNAGISKDTTYCIIFKQLTANTVFSKDSVENRHLYISMFDI